MHIFVLTGGLHIWYVCGRDLIGTVCVCHVCICDMYVCDMCVYISLVYFVCVCMCICVAYGWCVVWHEYGVFLKCLQDACIWHVGQCGCFRRAMKETTAIKRRQGCLRNHILTNLFCSTLTVPASCDLLSSTVT